MSVVAIPKMDLRIDVSEMTLPVISADLIIEGLRAAVLEAGQQIKQAWTMRALELDIRQSGAYIAGIRDNGQVNVVRETSHSGAQGEIVGWEMTIEVVNVAEHASIIEEGHAAFRLPEKIDWTNASGKIKRTEDGKPYLSIPFRHSAYASPAQQQRQGLTRATVKAMMPRHIYEAAKSLDRSVRLNAGRQFRMSVAQRALSARKPDGTVMEGWIKPGEKYVQHQQMDRYRWGGRLEGPKYESTRYHGMVKMGPPGHTEYMTFRTLTPDSPGWNIPAQPGLHVARHVAEHTAPMIGESLRSAFAAAVLRQPA